MSIISKISSSNTINKVKTAFNSAVNLGKKSSAVSEKGISQTTTKLIHSELNKIGQEQAMTTLSFADLERAFAQEVEGIVFKKAKTLQEAKDYATKVLGIERFDMTDLEMANQFNLSTTRAFNKTRSHNFIADEVEISKLSDIKMFAGLSEKELSKIPAATLHLGNGRNKIVFSLDFINKIDDTLKNYIDDFTKLGQISKNSKGFEQIDLVCDYRYYHTLNRYFRLYKAGKLTTKAKIDFHSLLTTAINEQNTFLSRQNSINEFVRSQLGKDLSKLPQETYTKETIKSLLEIRNKQNLIGNTGRPHRAIGMEKYVLHEEGHVFHSKTTGKSNLSSLKFAHPEEPLAVQREISTYAAESPGEMVGEKVAETLSGAKFSESIENIFEKYVGTIIPLV